MLILKHFYLDIGIRFPKPPSKEQFLFVLLVPPPKHPTVPPTKIFSHGTAKFWVFLQNKMLILINKPN